VCGSPVSASPAVSPVVAASPDPASSGDPAHHPEPPRWPWEVGDNDELHAVTSDPTVVPPPSFTQPGSRDTGPLPKGPTEPPRPRGRGRLLMLIGGVVAVVVIVAAGVVLLNRHPGNASADARATVKATHAPKPVSTPTPTLAQLRATPEGLAAVTLANLLSQASSEFANVPGATADVRACGSKLTADKNDLYTDASDSRALLAALGPLWKHAVLPVALLRDLTDAWQESDLQYIDLARWSDYALHGGCAAKNVDSNADLRDSYSPGAKATQDKEAFVRLWTPVADKFGLPLYQSSQF
jgi:hypothetical protein